MKFVLPKEVANLGKVVSKHAPVILSTAGAVGVVSTALLAVRATPSAMDKIRKAEWELAKMEAAITDKMEEDKVSSYSEIVIYGEDVKKEAVDETHPMLKLKTIDKVLLVWKDYAPAVISGTLSIAAIVAANQINFKRSAALISAYTMSDRLFSQYKEKVKETMPEVDHAKMIEGIAQDEVKKDPPNKSFITRTGKGNSLFRDSVSGRYFLSDMQHVRKAQNDINETIFQVNDASLNEFYTALGLDHIAMGDVVGWNTENPLRVYFNTALTDDENACVVVMYERLPFNKYNENYF